MLMNKDINIFHFYFRFMVDDNRAIFMYKDGSQAWDAKDFLVQQEDCVDVTIENQVYQGPATPFVSIF